MTRIVGGHCPVEAFIRRESFYRSGRPGSLLTLAPHRSGRAGSAASGSSTDSFATRRRVPAGPGSQAMATAIPKACLASSAIRCRDVETGSNLGGLAVFPSNGAPAGAPFPPRGLVSSIPPLRRCRVGGGAHRRARLRPPLKRYVRFSALVRGCGQAYALQTVEPVTYRCGTRRVCQARSSGSERDTRARPHAVAPMNCVPEDSRRRSTWTGRTHSPRARADGNQTPSSTVAVRAPSPS